MSADGAADLSLIDEFATVNQASPLAAAKLAAARLRAPASAPHERAIATSALARALLDLGEQARAAASASDAIDLAVATGDPHVAFRIRLSAAAVLAESGDVQRALDVLDGDITPGSGTDRGRLGVQRAYVLHHAGRLREALEALDAAEIAFGPQCSVDDRMRLLQNRALVLLQQGRFPAAEADLLESERLGTQAGYDSFTALSASNLGVLYGRERRVVESKRRFDVAIERFTRAGNPTRMLAIMHLDRAETLMHSGLVFDAVEAAGTAIQYVAPTGNRVLLGDAHLLHARTLLAARQFARAERAANVAAETLRQSGRDSMVTHADAVAVLALLEHRPDAGLLDAGSVSQQLVERCVHDGWLALADAVRVARVRAGRRTNAATEIASDLEHLRLGAFASQRDLALAGWYAEAIARASGGDLLAALDAARSGLDLLDGIVAEAETLERRSAAMRLGNDLSQLAIDFAVELGDADTVLAAAEGTRARALHDELAGAHRHLPLTADGAERLRRELAVRLGGNVLVEWVISAGDVWTVVFDGVARLVRLAPLAEVLRARDVVLVWLDRAAEQPDVSSAGAVRAMAHLDRLLVQPLDLPTNAAVVIVPVGGLHGLPWSGLPSLAARAVMLTPNAQLWLEADRRAAGGVRTFGVVVGPDVEDDGSERAAVVSAYPEVTVAAGAGATSATVRAMFAGLDLVHVAAHGRFRSDQPLLSTLKLGDGEATLYDTVPERVQSRLVVLSSCEGGAHSAADGSEVLGLAAVMLARGAGSVLAPLTVVRELECADFVADVHAELASGQPLALAVAAVRTRWLNDDDLSRWAVASGFGCFGSGSVGVQRRA